jgi:M6 family metalloprotease-like protein
MKRFLLLLLFTIYYSLFTSSAQPMKPCGTSVLACRHQLHKGALTRAVQSAPDSKLPSSRAEPDYQGEKRGLIILVSFPDQAFSDEDPRTLWSAIANQEGYADHGAKGSVSDYFYDQSYGQFRLLFDVVGPVEAKNPYAYYGKNIDWGEPVGQFDQNDGELVEEVCRAVSDDVHFADYDWDGDGEVEQVFLLYAGHGENDYWSKDESVIWPHMAKLSEDWGYEGGIVLQDVRIDAYACSNEIDRKDELAGMGTICHEFSHCLGLPDLYNTEKGNSVVGSYDLMDQGCYSGECWCPVGYSSYERYACGWLTPIPVEDAQTVTSLQPLHEQPDARIFRTDPEVNDYYLIEYRQKAQWDLYLPTAGLMAWHIDYDETAWHENTVNNDPKHLRVERMPLNKVPTGLLSLSAEVPDPGVWYDLHGRRLSARPSAPGLYLYNHKKRLCR